MPPPPPPPPGPPPPPAPPLNLARAGAPSASKKGGGSGDGRNQLLQDIRGGARLKKAVTNDRSAPIIEGKPNSANGSGNASRANGGGAPPSLGGLFSGGMPTLKPAGTRGQPPMMPPGRKPMEVSQGHTSPPFVPDYGSSKSTIPPGFGTVRRGGFPTDLMKGQAPLPPPSSNKPSLASMNLEAADHQGNGGSYRPGPPLPNKPPGTPSFRQQGSGPGLQRLAPTNKPPPPPKSPAVMNGPPALPSKPPNNMRRRQSLNENDVKNGVRPTVNINLSRGNNGEGAMSPSPEVLSHNSFNNRMQPPSPSRNASTPNLNQLGCGNNGTMKAPPPPPPNRDPSTLPVPGKGVAGGPPPPPPPNRTTPYLPRHPAGRPPPPPPTTSNRGPTVTPIPPYSGGGSAQPPPPPYGASPTPPPYGAPPPPPHRFPQNPPPPYSSQQSQLSSPPPPPPPSINKPSFQPALGNSAPPPPVRNSSTRNSMSGSSTASCNGDDFESRFYHRFISINDLPPPDKFVGCPKNYESVNQTGRREPPPVPVSMRSHKNTQLQLGNKMFENQTSEC